MALVTLGAAETFWRSHGHRPNVTDNRDLWSYYRSRVYGQKASDTVVLVGASRMQLGFSTEEFRKRVPHYRLVNLAIDGLHPLAILRDLASDRAFNGIVICAITAPSLDRRFLYEQQGWVDYYRHGVSLNDMLNAIMKAKIQERFDVVSPGVRLRVLINAALASHEWPPPTYLLMQADRSREADYSLLDIVTYRTKRLGLLKKGLREGAQSKPPPDQWLREAQIVNEWVAAIQGRGGEVVLVRFPTSEEHYDIEEAHFPRAVYWDRLAASSKAKTVHFRDYPELAAFNLPDTSHLDFRDAPEFTRRLLDILVRRNVLKTQ